jgi:putative flippase GtrA
MRRSLLQIIRYLFAGLIAFLLDFALLYVLHESLGIDLTISTILAGITVFFANFIVQQKFTFQSKAKSLTSLIWYSLLVIFNLFATVAIVQIGELFGSWMLGKIASSLLIPFWNYFVYRFLIFRSHG